MKKGLHTILNDKDILLVENFLELDLISRLNDLELTRKKNALYPGIEAPLSDDIFHDIRQKLIRELEIEQVPEGYGRFRLSTKGDNDSDKSYIHYDKDCIVLILYLSRDDTQAGTTFYSHKRTGLKWIDQKAGSKELFKQDVILDREFDRYESWEPWLDVSYKFNRALIFDGHLLHGGPQKFNGSGLSDGRKTIECFFKRDSIFGPI